MFNTQPMKGTTGTEYTLVAVTNDARIGYRSLGNDKFRVRVEPTGDARFPFPGQWKEPTPAEDPNTNRYSVVVSDKESLKAAIVDAFRIIQGLGVEEEDEPETYDAPSIPSY